MVIALAAHDEENQQIFVVGGVLEALVAVLYAHGEQNTEVVKAVGIIILYSPFKCFCIEYLS